MTLMPLLLRPLSHEYIRQLYARAQRDETIFRNILLNIEESTKGLNFFEKPGLENVFQNSSLDDIFTKIVCVQGYETRLSDFRVGPFTDDHNLLYAINFADFKTDQLKKDDALVTIEQPNITRIQMYKILSNSEVMPGILMDYHQL